MSYVAIKGGIEAIKSSKELFRRLLQGTEPMAAKDVSRRFPFACDRIMAEGALYSEKLAARAMLRSGGDLLEAAFYLRAHRSTCRRLGEAEPVAGGELRLLRRISSAFKDIEGGQILGPSCDYVIRLFRSRLQQEKSSPVTGEADPIYSPSAVESLRQRDQVLVLGNREKSPFDVTRSFPLPPYPRSALMQVMARGESGSMLAFAYTSMRGYGDVHPTIGDLRIGMAEICFAHPFTGGKVKIGEIRATFCETVGSFQRDPRDGRLRLSTGFGFCLGHNETRAISMSILDLAMHHRGYSVGGMDIAANPEIVIHHIDGIESMGFTNHFKLPHYVTFQADLHVYENARKESDE
ncbi:MAG: carbon-phosphorus lyase complex subunit PhnI [Proteobacteria bacterium]|nr:carbon-phosphorus lyase complex subunit PhnI [Pseudomonadota bacterium]MBU1455488.1 carbon-phosphorus lyase complex subunit PhnI [Pseudomonadota bacterium]